MRCVVFIFTFLAACGCSAQDGARISGSQFKPELIETLTPSEAQSLIAPVGDLPLNSLKSLRPDVAKVLCEHEGWLHLDGLTSVTPDAATVLALSKSASLTLNGLETLSPEVAERLAKKAGGLSLNGLKILPPQIAHFLSQHKGRLDLDGIKSIDDAALDALCDHEGHVSLQGVRKEVRDLTHARRALLLACDVGVNDFDNLETVSIDAAAALGRKASFLSMPRLKTITVEVARELAKTEHSLYLDGLEEIDAAVAECLAESRGLLPDLGLSGLRSISPEVAAQLGRKKGALYLNGLHTLTPNVAAGLGRHEGGPLALNGLRQLPPEVAAELSQCRGWTYIGVEELEPPAAHALTSGTHYRGIYLTSLSTLSGRLAEALVSNEKVFLELPVLRGEAISPEVSGAFAQSKCMLLRLSGVGEMTDELARDIGFYRCRLELTSVSKLTLEQARLLAANKGLLEFPLIHSLPEDVAKALAGQRGTLKFHSPVSRSMLEALKDHEGTLILCAATHDSRRNPIGGGELFLMPEDVIALCKHRGPLILQDLKRVSGDSLKEFAKRNAPTDLRWLTPMPNGEVLRLLRANANITLPDAAGE